MTRFSAPSLLAISIATAATVVPVHAEVRAQQVAMHIKAAPLERGLSQFIEQTRQQLLYSPELVRGKNGRAVIGSYSPDDALSLLLQGTGLRSRRTPAGAYVLEADSAAAQEVVGSLSAAPAPAPDEPETVEEIVVTGTLIRGVAPTGSNVVALSSEDIVASGAANTNQLLGRIPQVTNAFNQTTQIASFGSAKVAVRPNLRNLSAQGGTTTLVLLDGHRIVGIGTLETAPDPDVIPPGVLERVDVVPDGGSSIYGSDAVGGVINFITRKRFDGFGASFRYGFADDYQTFDTNITAGKDWGSGSAYVSYAYAHHDAIFGRDRDYVRQFDPTTGYCAPGTVFVNRGGTTTSYGLPDRTPGTRSDCDPTDDSSIYPRETRHSVFGRLNQDLADGVTFDVQAFYTHKEVSTFYDFNTPNNPYGITSQSGTITSANPYYVPIAPDTGSQTVQFSYSGIYDNRSIVEVDEFNITPTLTAELGGGWQIRALANYGKSRTVANSPGIDSATQTAALAGTTTATALNPYNIAATAPSVLASIYRNNYGSSDQEIASARVIADGVLIAIPGGDVRLAVGAEYSHEKFNGMFGRVPVGQEFTANAGEASRNVKSVFAELSVPVVGSSNAMPLIDALTLSMSARYDDYSDFGDTFNPRLGVSFKPVDWVSIKGNWGTSFNAPSLADAGGAPDTRIQVLGVSPFRDPADAFSNFFRRTVLLAGGNPALRPQTADTWSLGLDVQPPIVDGLRLSLTYYNISLKNQISIVPFSQPAAYNPAYSSFVIKNPTLAQIEALSAGMTKIEGAPSLASLYSGGASPYVVIDARRQNLGRLKQDGLDFNASYSRPTGFGSINASVGGIYTLHRKISAVQGMPLTDEFDTTGASQLSLAATIGAQIGDLSANARWNHTAGYDIPSLRGQTHVSSFNTVDLFFSYDVKGEGLADGLSFSLNVNNLLDQDPPFYSANSGYTNGSTLGRFLQFGVNKKF